MNKIKNFIKNIFNWISTDGLLHLLGYDHIEENDEQKMREEQRAVLADLGF
mgnify:CR=1 FL=1